ncbi:MAG TPA: helix-turn-helix transcriptional regulator, partial [Polyangiaceae bacterium]
YGGARPRDRWLAKKVLPHVGAGLRLRRSLTGLALDTASAEALFDPGGRCLNAQGMAEPTPARQALHAAVLALHREREQEAAETSSARDALIEGRWSLVERFDSDGRRFIVAYRNPAGVLDPRRLSPREREVCALLAEGTSQVSIAAQLGIQASTVASIASTVVNKLGLRSVKALPLFWRDAAGLPRALGRSDLRVIASSASSPQPQLTRAEREILDEVLHGHSNREIAARRGTSLRTVANQLASLLRKMRVGSRTELAARALADSE